MAVIVKAQYQYMMSRDIRETETTMVTSIMRGGFRDSKMLRSEVLALIKD
ncbi:MULTISPECIES: GTP cyclohydrolase I [unclassified Bradyrhizobium]|nr:MULTISPECIES: GTP cyclohydrolase I [unclassified Bradyrhizobium]